MWNNPGALNRVSDLLFAGAALILLYWLVRFAIHQPVFSLTELRVLGTGQISREQAAAIVKRDQIGRAHV